MDEVNWSPRFAFASGGISHVSVGDLKCIGEVSQITSYLEVFLILLRNLKCRVGESYSFLSYPIIIIGFSRIVL